MHQPTAPPPTFFLALEETRRRAELKRCLRESRAEFGGSGPGTEQVVEFAFRLDRGRHTNRDIVGARVGVLNGLYSTMVFNTAGMADYICGQGASLGRLIRAGDGDAVEVIRRGYRAVTRKPQGEKGFYSFATKYCSWSHRDGFALYDSRVDTLLRKLRPRIWSHGDESSIDLFDYSEFKSAVRSLDVILHGQPIGFKEMDKGLWILGDELRKLRELHGAKPSQRGVLKRGLWGLESIPHWLEGAYKVTRK